VDWNGNFNEYFVPYRNAGVPTVITSFNTALETYIVRVAKADGVDQTRAADVDPILTADGTPLSTAGEPYGELGLVNNNIDNSVNLGEFQKQAGSGILSGRGTVDDGEISVPPLIPDGDQLANSPLDDYGYTPQLSTITGLYESDATMIERPITADTGANRADADLITSFSGTVGIMVGGDGQATINGLTIGGEALSYIYNEATGEFEPAATRPTQVSGTNTVLELFDTDGELFAYVDEVGGVWIVDDINDNPNGQRDRTMPVAPADDLIEDDWLLEATFVSNGAAAVALPVRSTRNDE
jgi:hypothetical protein